MADTLYDSIVSPGTWPTPDEVKAARAAGFGRELPFQSKLLDDDTLAAAIVANRSPIAGYGFDPTRITPTTHLARNRNVLGSYHTNADLGVYDRAAPISNVHESTHRGLAQLGIAPPNAPLSTAYDAYARDPEELYVRHLMDQIASGAQKQQFSNMVSRGDIRDPKEWDRDVFAQRAADMYGPDAEQANQAELANMFAAQAVKQRKPYGGPR